MSRSYQGQSGWPLDEERTSQGDDDVDLHGAEPGGGADPDGPGGDAGGGGAGADERPAVKVRITGRREQRIASILVLLTSIGVIYLGYQDSRQGDCTARYNERQARSQQARAQAADRDREALETLVRSLVDDNTADGRERVADYLEALEATDRERSANPVPPPPADLCK